MMPNSPDARKHFGKDGIHLNSFWHYLKLKKILLNKREYSGDTLYRDLSIVTSNCNKNQMSLSINNYVQNKLDISGKETNRNLNFLSELDEEKLCK